MREQLSAELAREIRARLEAEARARGERDDLGEGVHGVDDAWLLRGRGGSGDGDVVRWSLAIIAATFIWEYFSWRSSGFDLPRDPLTTTFYEMTAAGFF